MAVQLVSVLVLALLGDGVCTGIIGVLAWLLAVRGAAHSSTQHVHTIAFISVGEVDFRWPAFLGANCVIATELAGRACIAAEGVECIDFHVSHVSGGGTDCYRTMTVATRRPNRK